MPHFESELRVPRAFGTEHWKTLLSQMKNGGEYTERFFFDQSEDCKLWRKHTLSKARKNLEIGIILVMKGGRALGESSANAATSAIEVAKRVTYTHTLCLSDDDADNNVAIGKVISTLEDLRGGVTPIIPAALTDYFAVDDLNKARNLVTSDYDSTMKFATKSYGYETAKKMAAELKEKHGLSANFPRFNKESYETPTKFTSADEIHWMCKLSIDDLHAEVWVFMDENCTHLTKDSTEYKMAFWQRVLSILKSECSMEDIANLLVKGLGCVFPVIMTFGSEATNGHAFFTMGTPAMLKEESMPRYICPGMSNRPHGGQKNNTHSVPYNVNILVSPTHCIIIDTNASCQNTNISNDNDGIYAGRAISERRIIRRVHENRVCNKPNDKHKRSELVRYDVNLSDHIYQHHQFMLIYATACVIGHTSYEYIFSKLRSTRARSNMTRECVNPDERCDGDHCFHRLMLIRNSIYFCFPMDHTTNKCLRYTERRQRTGTTH